MLSADEFWAFSLAFYSKPKVQQACIAIQDKLGLNVNLLLLCRYLDKQHLGISLAQCCQLMQAIQQQDGQLQEFRNCRRELKGQDQNAYQQALQDELALEKALQATLIEQLSGMSLSSPCMANLDQYLLASNTTVTQDDLIADINVILSTD